MADVAATLAGWSATTASNAPAGSTTIGTGLDDNLREIQGVVVRGLSHKGADIASATTTDIGAVEGLMHDITGTTTITSLGTGREGLLKILQFDGALTLTHNATSLVLPGGANITTVAGDVGVFISEGSGNWRCVSYVGKSGHFDNVMVGGGYGNTGVTISATGNIQANGTLTVDSLGIVGATATSPTMQIGNYAGNYGAYLVFAGTNAGHKNWQIDSNGITNDAMTFTPSTANGGSSFTTPAMTLNASGNLGLGVTPKAWNTGKVLELGGAAHGLLGGSSSTELFQNAYYASGWKYGASAAAGHYAINAGVHTWDVAASGTADAAITWTTAMTLGASGGLQMGTPTGGDKGAGTANFAADIYKNNTAYTSPDYVLEHWATGQIEKYADKEGAKDYHGLMPLVEVERFARERWHLPRFGQHAGHGLFGGSDALLASVEEAYLHLFQHESRLRALEQRMGG